VNSAAGVGERTAAACDLAAELASGTSVEADVTAIRERLAGPLRVAIAGQVKAGKSTLLNALVAERLAPTDAGECTRIVTWYHEGLGYAVRAVDHDESAHDLRHTRHDGALQIDLDGFARDDIARLDVAWPSSALHGMTLIDTPGLSSLDEGTSARTREFLAVEDERPSDADAVIYLLRHLHRRDTDFLEAFMDRSVVEASPVNTVGVLSRADEVGACRLDALESASRIAARYRADERLKALCLTTVAVAGLAAQTGLTLQEHEAATLRAVAALSPSEIEALLLTADRFARSEVPGVPSEARREVLHRLGMFGVRFAVEELRTGRVSTASDVSRALVEVSGLRGLQRLLDEHFLPRSRTLKARSALVALRQVARSLERDAPDATRRLEVELEAIESSAHEFAELRLVHMVMSGAVQLSADEEDEVRRMVGAGGVTARLALDEEADAEVLRAAALSGVERWRTKAANPLVDRDVTDACEVMARSYEGIYASVVEDVSD
jgi:hypothetical protein